MEKSRLVLLLYYGKLEIEDVHIFTVYHAKILEFLILKNIYFTSVACTRRGRETSN